MYRSFDATTVGLELNTLAQRNKGRLTSTVVLAAAKNVESPLHGLFLWDDTKAAMMYRKEQAKDIARNIILVRSERPQGDAENKPLFSSVTVHHSNGATHPGFITTNQTRRAPEYRDQIVDKALRELRDWYDRYWDLPEIKELIQLLEKHWPDDKTVKRLPEKKNVAKAAAF